MSFKEDTFSKDLYCAIQDHDVQRVQRILEDGASVNNSYPDKEGETPLHQASALEYTEIVQMLLQYGAHVNAETSELQTPLHVSASEDNTAIVKLLIHHGANLEARNKAGETPLMLALKNDKVAIAQVFLEHRSNVFTKDFKNLTPIHWAAKFGRKYLVKSMIDQSVDVNCLDSNGWSPLNEASNGRHISVMEMLIRHAAKVNTQDKKGWTPLHYAAAKGTEDVISALLSHGADVNMTDSSGETALQKAFTNDMQCAVLALLKNGASTEETDAKGRTPLHRACLYGNTEIIATLQKKGAAVQVLDRNGCTPLHNAINSGNIDAVNRILDYGANTDSKDKMGLSPLHRATIYGKEVIVESLLSKGACVNIKDSEMRTPLHHASYYGRISIINILVNYFADVHAEDNLGCTPLHVAAQSGNDMAVGELLMHGADMDAKTKQNQTPYDLAEVNKHNNVMKKFKEYLSDGLPLEVKLLNSTFSDGFEHCLAKGYYYSYVGKIMIVGNESVGKTAITRLIIGKKPHLKRKPTEGIKIHTSRVAIDRQSRQMVQKGLKFEDTAYSNLFMTRRDSIRRREAEVSHDISFQDDDPNTTDYSDEARNPVEQDDISVCNSIQEMEENLEQEPTENTVTSPSDCSAKSQTLRQKLRNKFLRRQKSKEFKLSSKKMLRSGAKRASQRGIHRMKLVPVIILDFAGHEVFYSTHQSFLTHRGVYIIVINGSIDLDDEISNEIFIPGRHGKPTTIGYIQFWVSSILSYAKGRSLSFPKIIICCTHKDKVPKAQLDAQRRYIFGKIKKMFEGTTAMSHLVLEEKIFLNALDPSDPELDELKDVIVKVLYSQPTWGERMPKSWIHLEMEIHAKAKEGDNIITFKQLEKINQKNPTKILSKEEIAVFLQVHHSLGNIIYFPLPGLKDYIIISPSYLVEALRCIVTDKRFVKEERLESWTSLNRYGILHRADVHKILEKQKDFKGHQEFLLELMSHLDIIARPRTYSKGGQFIRSDFYFVPSMIKKQITETSFFSQNFVVKNSIGLSFKFHTTILPPAIGFRLIASCLDIWKVKSFDDQTLLCSGMVVLVINKFMMLTVKVKEQRIDVNLTHASSRHDIIPETASSVRECLQDCLTGISDSYKVSSAGTQTDQSKAFHVEYTCYNLTEPCYYQEEKDWTCNHGYKLTVETVHKWYTDKEKEDCERSCTVNMEALKEKPSELHLAKLSLHFTWSDLKPVLVHLGLQVHERQTIEEDYPGHNVNIRFLCLRKWRMKTLNGTLEDIYKAIVEEKQNPHNLCQVFRDKKLKTNIGIECLEREPTDEDIDKIATLAIEESLLVCVNLGIEASYWLQMKSDLRKIVEINRTILTKWRNEHPGKPKLRELAQALSNVGINIDLVLSDEF